MELQSHSVLMTEYDREITATVRRERNRLSNFIRRRVRDPEDADDILQDVFFEFVEAYRLPAPIERASAWLLRVARNRVIDLFRKKREQSLDGMGEKPTAADGDRLDLLLPAPDASPEAAYARSLLLTELQAALDELPADQREVFVAHELDGVSFKEMASRSGVPMNTLLARKRYAVLRLRNRLQSIYDEFDM
jgi:RNA polymerase sigma factor (sigma-70 family)